MNRAQRAAVGATLAPGVNVIWGPPGTGKTHVIVKALRRIIFGGRSALLVSNANVAVDQALERVWKEAGEPGPGVIVRVGYPSLASVGDHEWLPLEKACAHLGGEVAARLAQIEQRIVELNSRPELRELAAEEKALAGITVRALDAAADKVANHRSLQAAQEAAAAAEGELQIALLHIQETADELAAAEAAMRKTAPDRAAWARANTLAAGVASRRAAVAETSADVARLGHQLFSLEEAALEIEKLSWWRRRRGRRQNRTQQREVRYQLDSADARLAQRERLRDEAESAAQAAVTAITTQRSSAPGATGCRPAERADRGAPRAAATSG